MKNLNTKNNISVVVITMGLMFSEQVLSAPSITNMDEEAERVSQYISEADINREAQINKNNTLNKKLKRKSQNNSIHSAMREHRRLSVNLNAGWIQASSQTLNISIPDSNNRDVWLSRANTKQEDSLIVGLPNTESSTQTRVTSDGSVVYVDDQRLTDVAVQSFDDSTRILTVLNGVNSPTEYSYPVTLPVGGEIVKSDDGGILIFDENKSLVGGFSAPWAVDSDGKVIPTYYDIRGNSVVQVVDHLNNNPHYPVIADPWLWKDLISSASWAWSAPGWTLKVYPTKWARSLAFSSPTTSYLVGLAGWSELYAKYGNLGSGIKFNLTGMKDQYVCHQQVVAVVAPTKSSWNLDEYRPSVGYLATVNAQCNPGGPNIFD